LGFGFHDHGHEHAGLADYNWEIEGNKKIKKAAYFALGTATILAILKFVNFFLTGSLAIQASALDSLMDVGVSMANFFVIRLTQRARSKSFPFGFDKAAALIAFLQVLLVGSLSAYLVSECYEKFFSPSIIPPNSYFGMIIIFFAFLMTTALVLYQRIVVKETGSLIIKADMLHYKTDLFANVGLLVGLGCMWFFGFGWLDPLIGGLASLYVLFATISLGWDALSSLLDMNNLKLVDKVHNVLISNKIDLEKKDIHVLFSGTRTRVNINICLDKVLEGMCDIPKIKNLLKENFQGFNINITFIE
jgi:ferrous-iron efflux pump FieF